MATQKERFADWALELSQKLIEAMDDSEQFENTYFDNTWNSGGGDAIEDADVSSRLVTAAELSNFITLIQQFRDFVGNSSVTSGDYAATLNAMRHAGT